MKKLKVLDVIIIIFFVLLFTGICFNFFKTKFKNNSILLIESMGEKFYYNLNQQKIIKIKGKTGYTFIKIDNGKFRFIESSCPNKDCIKIGWVSIPNFPIICLPNQVSAYIVDKKEENEFDGISR